MSEEIEVIAEPEGEVDGLGVRKVSDGVYIGSIDEDHDGTYFWVTRTKVFEDEIETLIEKLREMMK